MSKFVCPECGHSSEYDEWEDSARCESCGFEPPAGNEMRQHLREGGRSSGGAPGQGASISQERTGLTRYLPASGREFFSGLAWGVLAFAIIMFISSRLDWSGSFARCLGLSLPVLTTFGVWGLYARREHPG
jgi:hypothetical protein